MYENIAFPQLYWWAVNMPHTSNALLSPINYVVARGSNDNQGQPMMHLQISDIVLHSKWAKHLKICLKLQIPYYHLLRAIYPQTNPNLITASHTCIHNDIHHWPFSQTD